MVLLPKKYGILLVMAIVVISISCSSNALDSEEPIHLDDIHFIVSDEEAAVTFFQKHFGAREMAHPGDRFDLVRFLSLKWQDPTITITAIGPYDDLPPERNKRWLDAKIVSPKSDNGKAVFGPQWLAISTPSIVKAREQLLKEGAFIAKDKISLPMEPNTRAFSIYGPDGVEIVIVERPNENFGNSKYAIDHIQFMVKNIKETQTFFEEVFAAKPMLKKNKTLGLKIADANLIFSEPKEFGFHYKEVVARQKEGTIRIGLDHLGFLFQNITSAVDQAILNDYKPIFEPQRYVYKNKPTVYTFTAFSTPEFFNIEMVQVDGRIGPHAYYMKQDSIQKGF